VLFSDAVDSACGMNSAAVGPFYCPGDGKLYIDLSFYNELDRRFGAPGDFAQAYVIAHEVGHHVQNLIGVFDQVRRNTSRADANAISVRQELQADCFAGVWGHYAARRGVLQPGDMEEGLNAAAAIGDDRIQRRTQGQVTPETWTHGSSEQRVRWFRTGLESGQMSACDTF
jgi:predicted metalloprotease